MFRNLLFLLLLITLSGCLSFDKKPLSAQLLVPETGATIESTPSAPVLEKRSTDELLNELAEVKRRPKPPFRFGKGDILTVSVYGEPDLTVSNVPVRVDGMISYPLIGDVPAEGKTVEELVSDVTARLKQFVREPKVAVIVTQFNSMKYTLSGEVRQAGVYPLNTDVTLSEAIALAGGLAKGLQEGATKSLADLSGAYIVRNGEYLPIDFVELLNNIDLRFDIELESGDYIFIPSGLNREIFVLGEVPNPDIYSFKEGLTAVKAITDAGGFTPDSNVSHIHIVRGSLGNPQLYVLDLNAILTGNQADVLLAAGDIVYLPPSGLTEWNRILSKLIPSVSAIQTGLILQNTFK